MSFQTEFNILKDYDPIQQLHESTTMFATQYIFTTPKLVCTIKQVKLL